MREYKKIKKYQRRNSTIESDYQRFPNNWYAYADKLLYKLTRCSWKTAFESLIQDYLESIRDVCQYRLIHFYQHDEFIW